VFSECLFFGLRNASFFGRALARFDRRRRLFFGIVEKGVHGR
jgi:hypothetical protein